MGGGGVREMAAKAGGEGGRGGGAEGGGKGSFCPLDHVVLLEGVFAHIVG